MRAQVALRAFAFAFAFALALSGCGAARAGAANVSLFGVFSASFTVAGAPAASSNMGVVFAPEGDPTWPCWSNAVGRSGCYVLPVCKTSPAAPSAGTLRLTVNGTVMVEQSPIDGGR